MIDNKSNLAQFIGIYNNIIPTNLCKDIVEYSSQVQWNKHGWYSNRQKIIIEDNENIEISNSDLAFNLKAQLSPIIQNTVENYQKTIGNNLFKVVDSTPIRLNKYNINSSMSLHIDHIQSAFDGIKKGIPVLSVVGLLNNDFEGGEFIFWNNYIVPIDIGSILIFPSNFLYEHRVDKIKSGIRYSFVSWFF